MVIRRGANEYILINKTIVNYQNIITYILANRDEKYQLIF